MATLAAMTGDEWRVEVELDEEEHGDKLGERMRTTDLDEEARARLGRHAIVTRDGPRLFVYTDREQRAEEAERLIRELVAAEGVEARVVLTRWHPIEETWRDATLPLPVAAEEEQAERSRKEASERAEAEREGELDWHVRLELPARGEAVQLEHRLEAEGVPVSRRWRYVLAGALTEERAETLARRLRADAPEGTEVSVEVNPSDLPSPLFVFLGAGLDRR